MEVNRNSKIDPPAGVATILVKGRTSQAATDTSSFETVEELTQSLQATPIVRPDKTALARHLISDVKYPPAHIIRGIVSLFARSSDGRQSDEGR